MKMIWDCPLCSARKAHHYCRITALYLINVTNRSTVKWVSVPLFALKKQIIMPWSNCQLGCRSGPWSLEVLIDFRRSWAVGTDACISLQFTCTYAGKHTICLVCTKNTHPQVKQAVYLCHARNDRKGAALVKTETPYPWLYGLTFFSCLCSQMYGISSGRFGVLSLRLLVWEREINKAENSQHAHVRTVNCSWRK